MMQMEAAFVVPTTEAIRRYQTTAADVESLAVQKKIWRRVSWSRPGYEDRGSCEASPAQIAQRLVRLIERVGPDGCADGHGGGKVEKLARVRTGQIGDRSDRSFLPQQSVRK